MTEAMITDIVTALLVSLPPTLVAWATLRQGKQNRKAVADVIAEVADKVDVVNVKATEIHALTNSSLSNVTAQLAVANEKIIGLEKLMVEAKKGKKK